MGALENGLFPNWAMVKIINHLKIGGGGAGFSEEPKSQPFY
jgi:hypothetical protein